MKKSLMILFAVIAVIAMAMPVFAAGVTISAETSIGSVLFAPSTKVSLCAASNNGQAGTNPNTYCVTSLHDGSKNQSSGLEFGALSTESTIKSKVATGVSTLECCQSTVALPSGL